MQPTILSHGSMNPLPGDIKLKAGQLSVVYEAGFLRYICLGDLELIRMINHAVRDKNWGTVPITIANEKIASHDDHFSIEYEAICQNDDIHFVWACSIHGKSDNSITFNVRGKAISNFKRNRIGLTVLHPIESCAGIKCKITHTDNKETSQVFTDLISANQIFFDIAAMWWRPKEGVDVKLSFEGDTFETEDQRNWLDASYKTYCTPLSKPFPVEINKGDEINQTVRLDVQAAMELPQTTSESISIHLDTDSLLPFPKIGIQLSKLHHSDRAVTLVEGLSIDYLRLNLSEKSDNLLVIKQAQQIIKKIGCELEVALFLPSEFIENWIEQLLPCKDAIRHFIILPANKNCTDSELVNLVAARLKYCFPSAKIGGGTDAFFAELNRSRTPTDELDFITFSINPQVHAYDIRTMTENLQAHQYAVESARKIGGNKKIHVGPVTFKMRWNPNATSTLKEHGVVDVPEIVDPRQLSLYGAGWMLGSIKYLAETNVNAITYFETCGWTGLMTHPDEPWPDQYKIPEQCVYPVYLVLREILKHKEKSIVRLTSSHPLLMDGLAIAINEGKYVVILANFTDEEKVVDIPNTQHLNSTSVIDTENIKNLMLDVNAFPDQRPTQGAHKITIPLFGIAILELTNHTKKMNIN